MAKTSCSPNEERLLQVFAIDFVTFLIDFVLFAIEFVTFAVEFVRFAIELVGFAIELIAFAQEFIIIILTAMNQPLITRWIIFAMENTT